MSRLNDLKKIDIVSWLVSQGHEIKKETNTKVWFNAPSRNETNPSLCVFKGENKYKDYGSNNPKGDILDLICEIESCDLAKAMDILSDNREVSQYEPISISNEPLITVSHVYDSFISPELIVYIKSRCIPKNVYSKHCKEVHYFFKDNPDRVYYGIGWANDAGGWEIRNKSHKYCCSPKSITTVNNDGGTLNIFEGWINYLSALVYFDVERLEGTTIVLNGLGLFNHIKDTLLQYQKINCFLDFGRGGDSVTDMIKSIVGVDRCHDHRYLHGEDEDFNDMLIRIKS